MPYVNNISLKHFIHIALHPLYRKVAEERAAQGHVDLNPVYDMFGGTPLSDVC